MKRFLLFSYVLFHCSLAYSQLSATHSKPLSLFSNNYIIDFEYIINSGDTLFNGDYHLYNSVENKLLDDTFKYVNIKGTYDKHIPTGFWSVVSGQAEVNSEAFFNNYLLSRRIKEIERSINNRPIRKFGYHSPNEVLKERCVAFIG
tara:strand:- start:3686 stop:4123 length:438 start_codon:yes stop_codon:yes gene_type:complete